MKEHFVCNVSRITFLRKSPYCKEFCLFQVKSTKHILEPWNFPQGIGVVFQPALAVGYEEPLLVAQKKSWHMISSEVYSRANDGVICMKPHLVHSQKTKVEASKELDAVLPDSCHL